MIGIRRKNAGRRGAQLVEFTLVSLQLLVVMFAMVEFARMGLVYTSLASASRIAARYAITHGADRTMACGSSAGCGSTDGTAAVSDICGASGLVANFASAIDFSKINCSTTGLGGNPGTTVKVTVNYPFDPWFGLLPLKGFYLSSTSSGVITY
jgi:Flp pilus assembly protein TadG